MKDRIKNNLKQVTQLSDRKLLKEMFQFVFDGMVDYTDEVYNTIHQRVFDELNLDVTRKHIYVTVTERKNYDKIDDFMFPMCREDVNPQYTTTDNVIEQLEAGERIVLGTTCLQGDYLLLKDIDSLSLYDGCLITNVKKYSVKVFLEPSLKYIDKIEELYHYFQQNNLEWVSVNAPYIYKFFDYVLAEEVELGEGEEIQEVSVSLDELEKIKNDSLIPLWNLEETFLVSSNFPTATGDSLRYQHMFGLEAGESTYHYIVRFEQDHDGYVIRDDKSISIVITEENISKWPVYKIHNPKEEMEYEYDGPIYSNGNKESFMVGYAKQQKRIIRSKAELLRQLKSYEASDLFEIQNIEIVENTNREKETFEINPFIEDDIRTDAKRKQLQVTVSAKESNYLSRDVLSFLIGELQYYFPEYECVGILR